MSKKEKRYEAWAGRSSWAGLGIPGELLNTTRTIWPIVNLETCGPIEGSPTVDQFYAVVFDPDEQERICNLLNAVEEIEEIEDDN